MARDAADFSPWDRVYAFFRRWRDHDLVKEFHDRLRAKVREKLGRDTEPTVGVIDSQSVKADVVVGTDNRGYDGGKQINGRKRHVVVDALGPLLGVMITAADAGDRTATQVLYGPLLGGRHGPLGPGVPRPVSSGGASTSPDPRTGDAHSFHSRSATANSAWRRSAFSRNSST